MNIFQMLDEICDYKTDLDFDDPEINKAYDIYMINRYLSMVEMLVPVVVLINRPGMDKRDHYNFLRNVIPKSRYKFNYIKKNVDDTDELNLKCLCKIFEIGMTEAKMYLPLLKKEQLAALRGIFAYGKSGKKISADAD